MLLINNLSLKVAKHQAQIEASLNRVLASGWLILGPEVKNFEKSFADFLGAKHCLGLANGTDAIELALRAMGVGPGEQVATVANAGMYATTALLALGAKPYFMDVNLDTRGATFAEVTRAVEAGVKAVVVTHLYGRVLPEIALIAQYCKNQGIALLEDCAQVHGAQLGGKRAGTFGDAASFSFYPTKNLGGLGDGGAVVTNNPELANKVGLLRQYGWTEKYKVEVPGARNSRLDEIQAAILFDLLPYLDDANARRRQIAARYSTEIEHADIITPAVGGEDYVAHLYVIQSRRRDSLRAHLQCLNIGTDIHYPIPDYRQPVLGSRFSHVNLSNTETLANEVLTLPCYPEMEDEEVKHVIDAVRNWPLCL